MRHLQGPFLTQAQNLLALHDSIIQDILQKNAPKARTKLDELHKHLTASTVMELAKAFIALQDVLSHLDEQADGHVSSEENDQLKQQQQCHDDGSIITSASAPRTNSEYVSNDNAKPRDHATTVVLSTSTDQTMHSDYLDRIKSHGDDFLAALGRYMCKLGWVEEFAGLVQGRAPARNVLEKLEETLLRDVYHRSHISAAHGDDAREDNMHTVGAHGAQRGRHVHTGEENMYMGSPGGLQTDSLDMDTRAKSRGRAGAERFAVTEHRDAVVENRDAVVTLFLQKLGVLYYWRTQLKHVLEGWSVCGDPLILRRYVCIFMCVRIYLYAYVYIYSNTCTFLYLCISSFGTLFSISGARNLSTC
jgi:hypothetical protein